MAHRRPWWDRDTKNAAMVLLIYLLGVMALIAMGLAASVARRGW